MKKLLVCLIFLVLISGCNNFVWDPSGSWIFTFTYWASDIQTETLIFSGSDSTGSVFGYTILGVNPPQTGTYTKTGDYGITFYFDFIDVYGYHIITDFTGNSTEATPNSMTGTGTWMMDGFLYDNPTFTAVKTTNLQ